MRDQSKKVRQSDIAESLGVSTVTVSNALAGRKGVSEELRAEILREADRLGYSRETRRMKLQKADPSPSQLARQVYRFAVYFAQEYSPDPRHVFTQIMDDWPPTPFVPMDSFVPITVSGNNPDDRLNRFIAAVHEAEVDGILTIGDASEAFINGAMEALELPWVMIDGTLGPVAGDSLFTETFRAGHVLTETLLNRGHERIGLLLNPPLDVITYDFYQGFNKALLEENRGPQNDSVVLMCDETSVEGPVASELVCEKRVPSRLLNGPYAVTAWVLSDLSLLQPLSQALGHAQTEKKPEIAVIINNSKWNRCLCTVFIPH